MGFKTLTFLFFYRVFLSLIFGVIGATIFKRKSGIVEKLNFFIGFADKTSGMQSFIFMQPYIFVNIKGLQKIVIIGNLKGLSHY